MLRRPGDSDSFIGDNIDIFISGVGEAMARIGAQIHFMMPISDVEGLRQFPRAGTKLAFIINAAPALHQRDPAKRLHRADQDKAVGFAFHEHVQHPVRAVTEINISCARFVSFDERARARTRGRMAGFVVLRQIRLDFDNFSRAISPDQLSSHQFPGARNRVASEKSCPNDSVSHLATTSPARSIEKELKPFRLVINRDLHVRRHRLSLAECRNKFRFAQIVEGGIAKSKKRRLLAQDFEVPQTAGCIYF